MASGRDATLILYFDRLTLSDQLSA